MLQVSVGTWLIRATRCPLRDGEQMNIEMTSKQSIWLSRLIIWYRTPPETILFVRGNAVVKAYFVLWAST